MLINIITRKFNCPAKTIKGKKMAWQDVDLRLIVTQLLFEKKYPWYGNWVVNGENRFGLIDQVKMTLREPAKLVSQI